MKITSAIVLATTVSFALTACELRREGADEPAQDAASAELPEPAMSESPEPSPSATPAASIIRDEEPAPQNAGQLPVQPVEITVPFPDGPTISSAAERQLVNLLQEDAMDEDWPLIVAGHTDSRGNDAANLRASRSRAETVAAWLVEHGVSNDRIEVIGFGEQNPIAPNALPDGSPNEEGRRLNRRVEIRIAPPESDSDDQDA